MTSIPRSRWLLKKSSRALVAMGGSALSAFSRKHCLVLTYHRIQKSIRDPFAVSPSDFERHMSRLRMENRVADHAQLLGYARGAAEREDNACLITIDDGMASTYFEALPILLEYRIPAVIYVSSALIGRDVPGLPERYMNWNELRQIADTGLITIGSHAHTHRSLGSMSPMEAKDEIVRSRAVLEDGLGISVQTFAYPFGTRGDFNSQTRSALDGAGFESGFISMHGYVAPGSDPLALPRIKVEGGESDLLFSLISRGATVPWRLIDESLWRLQRNRAEIS